MREWTLFTHIYKAHPTIPIIVLTGYGDEVFGVNAVKQGAADFLNKNKLDSDSLKRSIIHSIERKELQNQCTKTAESLEKRVVERTEELEALTIELKKELYKRKRSEAQNRELTSIVNKTNNAIIIANAVGKIEWVNEGFQKLTEYSFEEVKDNFAANLNPGKPTGLNPDSEHYQKVMRTRKPVSYEVKNFTKSGKEYWALTTLSPIMDNEGNVKKVIAIDSDISYIKEVEEKLIKANTLVKQSMKLKEEFLANMSHEIRTPLNAIIGFSDILSKKNLEKQEQEYVETIKSAGENLLALINDILDISKIDSGMMTFEEHLFSVRETMKSVQAILKEKANEKGLKLLFDCDEEIPDVLLGDPTRLTQIILNLAGNAIKFTQKGSVQVTANVLKNGSYNYSVVTILLEFLIKDTGVGIAQDQLEHVFERFRQAESHTTRKYGGTGLGLNIAKQLVELQGGTLSVKSKFKEGSVFSFCIPYKKSKDKLLLPKIKEKKYNLNDLRKLNTLLVEDNPLNIKLIECLFSLHNFKVQVVPNGMSCIAKLRENNLNIILMDIEMPILNGYDTTIYIRNKLKNNIPIIAMTAHAMNGEREKCLRLGMNDYISKPINADLLFEKMNNISSKFIMR